MGESRYNHGDYDEDVEQSFREYFGVDTVTGGKTCARRLHGKQCLHGYEGGCSNDHEIPHADHPELWLDDGDPAVYACHLYPQTIEAFGDIADWCEEFGFTADVRAGLSYYYPGNTVLVAIETED